MAIKNQQEPLMQHDSATVPPTTDQSAHSPLSPSLTDMELEIDIELTGPGGSSPIKPAPGEDPMLPLPPSEPIPPKSNALGLHHDSRISHHEDAVGIERLGHRSLPRGKEGLLRQRRRKRADAVSSPNGPAGADRPHDAWSKKQIYEHSVKKYLQNEPVDQTHGALKHTESLLYPFQRLSMSPSRHTAKGDLKTKAFEAESKVIEPKGPMSRFLPPNKEEAFIGFMPDSAEATIDMVKRECPSLTSVPPQNLSLALHFDGSPSWVTDVLFRVIPEAWPAAVTGPLPLIHVKHHLAVVTDPDVKIGASLPTEQISAGRAGQVRKVSDEDLLGAFESEGNTTAWKSTSGMMDKGTQVEVGMQDHKQKGKEEKTWDQLVKEGVLLGIH